MLVDNNDIIYNTPLVDNDIIYKMSLVNNDNIYETSLGAKYINY